MQKIVWLKNDVFAESTHLIIVQENEHPSHSAFMAGMAILKKTGIENPIAEIYSSDLEIDDDNIFPDPIPVCWLMYETYNELDERCWVLRMTGQPQKPNVLFKVMDWLLPELEDKGLEIITCLSYAYETEKLGVGDLYVYDWAIEARKGVIMTTNKGLITDTIPVDGFSWSIPMAAKAILPDIEGLFTINIKADTLIDRKAANTLCRFLSDTHDLTHEQLIIDELYDILNNQYKIDEPFLGGMFDEDI